MREVATGPVATSIAVATIYTIVAILASRAIDTVGAIDTVHTIDITVFIWFHGIPWLVLNSIKSIAAPSPLSRNHS